MGFIAPQDLGPLGPGPPLVSVSPVQPSDLLSLREEWLLGSTTAWNLQFLGDDSPDVALGVRGFPAGGHKESARDSFSALPSFSS